METYVPDSISSVQETRAPIQPWLPTERRSFRDALKKFGPYHWEEISIAVGTRTIGEVALYWHDSYHGMTWRRFSKWTDVEKATFMHALTTSDTGEDCDIAAMAGTRSPREVKSHFDVIKTDLKRIQDAQRQPDRNSLLVTPAYGAGFPDHSSQVAGRSLSSSCSIKQPSAASLGVFGLGYPPSGAVNNQNTYGVETSVGCGNEKTEPKGMQAQLPLPSLVRSQRSHGVVDNAGAWTPEDPWNYKPKALSIVSIMCYIFGRTEPAEKDVDSAVIDKLMEDILLPLSPDPERSDHGDKE